MIAEFIIFHRQVNELKIIHNCTQMLMIFNHKIQGTKLKAKNLTDVKIINNPVKYELTPKNSQPLPTLTHRIRNQLV